VNEPCPTRFRDLGIGSANPEIEEKKTPGEVDNILAISGFRNPFRKSGKHSKTD
jgi:hypothetical protein